MNVFLNRAWQMVRLASHGLTLKRSEQDKIRFNAKAHLSKRMGTMHGLPQKLGQILDMASNFEQDHFEDLHNQAQAMDFSSVEQVLHKEWGQDPEKIIEHIEPQGLAASLGQVHKAKLKDGSQVAIKVQYPQVLEALMADLKFLGWLSKPLGNMKIRGFDLESYREEILRDLLEELDYKKEAQSQNLFKQNIKAQTNIIVPEVVPSLSTGMVLVSQWHCGQSISEVQKHWEKPQKQQLGRAIIDLFCHSLFKSQLVHADPNPGNYQFAYSGNQSQIIVYDFGCLFKPNNQEHLLFLKLLNSCLKRDNSDPLAIYAALGFNVDLLKPIRDKLAAVSQVLLQSYLNPMAITWDQTARMNDIQTILGDQRWNLRSAGPASLIFLMRAFAGVEYYLRKLNEPVCFYRILEPYLHELEGQVDQLYLPEISGESRKFEAMAEYLQIHVKKQGQTKVQLTLPWKSLDELENLMDEELKAKLQKQGLNILELKQQAQKAGYPPMDIFQLEEGTTQVHVWLE